MKKTAFLATALCFLLEPAVGSSAHNLTLEIPACIAPRIKALPPKYYDFRSRGQEFKWVRSVTHRNITFGGSGNERIDGSEMYTWYSGQRVDLNNDGTCDMAISSFVPLSTGGDAMVLNTFYLGSPSGWIRHGVKLGRSCNQDIIGCEEGSHPEAYIISSDDLGMIHDEAEGITYFIGALRYRTDADDAKRGYRILRWNQKGNHFDEFNKWIEGSPASKVYAFFKANGASGTPTGDVEAPILFDPEVEKAEINLVCERYLSSSSAAMTNKRAHIKCPPK